MKKFKLYTYNLWADESWCTKCDSRRLDDNGEKCLQCGSKNIQSSYSVNDVYPNEEVEAENMEEAIKLFEFKEGIIEVDNNCDNELTCYFRYISGIYNGSPACEVRTME